MCSQKMNAFDWVTFLYILFSSGETHYISKIYGTDIHIIPHQNSCNFVLWNGNAHSTIPLLNYFDKHILWNNVSANHLKQEHGRGQIFWLHSFQLDSSTTSSMASSPHRIFRKAFKFTSIILKSYVVCSCWWWYIFI